MTFKHEALTVWNKLWSDSYEPKDWQNKLHANLCVLADALEGVYVRGDTVGYRRGWNDAIEDVLTKPHVLGPYDPQGAKGALLHFRDMVESLKLPEKKESE